MSIVWFMLNLLFCMSFCMSLGLTKQGRHNHTYGKDISTMPLSIPIKRYIHGDCRVIASCPIYRPPYPGPPPAIWAIQAPPPSGQAPPIQAPPLCNPRAPKRD